MTQQSGPWAGSPGTFSQDQWSLAFAHLFPSGVFSDPQALDLLPYGDSSGMHVKVRAGHAFVNGQWYYNDAEATQNIRNGDSQPRIDVVHLHRNSSTKTIVITVTEGAAAVTPLVPTLAGGVDDVPLAYVTVAANRTTSIAPAECVGRRPFMSRYSRAVGVGDPLPLLPKIGDTLTKDDDELYFYSTSGYRQVQARESTTWRTCVTGAGWTHYLAGGNYPTALQARLLNGVVHLRGLIVKNAAGAASSRLVFNNIAQLPTGMFPPFTHRYAAPAGWAADTVDVFVGTDGAINIITGSTTYPAQGTFPIDTSFIVD